MTTSIARSLSVRQERRISWRTRQNARNRSVRVTAGCSPRQACGVKAQFRARGWRSRHSQFSWWRQATRFPAACASCSGGIRNPQSRHNGRRYLHKVRDRLCSVRRETRKPQGRAANSASAASCSAVPTLIKTSPAWITSSGDGLVTKMPSGRRRPAPVPRCGRAAVPSEECCPPASMRPRRPTPPTGTRACRRA